VHHGIWDMDIPAAPILTDHRRQRRAIQASPATKAGILLCLRPHQWRPVWPIPERPLAKGDVPANGIADAALPDEAGTYEPAGRISTI